MKSVRKRLTYANVISSLALFLVLAGGTAFAANQLGTNSVGSKQLKKNAVTSAKIKNGAVTGSKIKLSTLGTVPTATTATSAKTAESANTAKTAESASTANLAKSLPTLTWNPITLENGWVTYDTEYYAGAPAYTKDAEGFVHLSGAADGASSSSLYMGILPAGFRPPTGTWVTLGSTNGSYDVQDVQMEITSEGEMYISYGAGANLEFVSLNGVEFYVGN